MPGIFGFIRLNDKQEVNEQALIQAMTENILKK